VESHSSFLGSFSSLVEIGAFMSAQFDRVWHSAYTAAEFL
jgi:hypothetical protein